MGWKVLAFEVGGVGEISLLQYAEDTYWGYFYE